MMPPDLTASILARTSGPACGRLRELVGDLLDGTLPAAEGELARGHLVHCPACRSLLASLEAAERLLPSFALADPGAGFAAAVLDRTRTIPPFTAPPKDPLLEGWARLLRRPRASLEAAYLATAAGFILLQLPLPGPPRRQVETVVLARLRTASQLSRSWSTPGRVPGAPGVRGGFPSQLLRLPVRAEARSFAQLRRIWTRLAQAGRDLRDRLWPRNPEPAPNRTEPSRPAPRPAP